MARRQVRSIPPLPSTERGAFCQIVADAPGERVIYCNGSNVIWRSLAAIKENTEKPEDVFCWRGHAKKTTCAAMSPNSQWMVSGDVGGAIRVWGAKGEHILKNEYKLWDGTVKDVAWSGDSTRIVAAGDGKEVRATAIIWDTGSKTGEVAGHSKQVNSISFRSQRPFRVATGSEDFAVAFYQGPPFKFTKSHTAHSNFVNSVRYSPNGDWVISAGADSKLCLYEGKDGELVKEFAKPEGISGSIWAAEWSPDSARVVTAGGDRKIRVWDREAGAQVSEQLVGTGSLDDMQVGVAWSGEGRVLSVCLDGRLLQWDVAADGALSLATTVDGTQGPLSCLAFDAQTGAFVQGSSDGSVAVTKPNLPPLRAKAGKSVQHVVTHSAGRQDLEARVMALDNCVRRLSLETCAFVGEPVEVKESIAGAGWLDVEETKLLIATAKCNIHCVGTGSIEWSKAGALPRVPTAVATLPGSRVAVALEKPEGTVSGVQSSEYNISLYAASGTSAEGLTEQATLKGHLGEVTTIRFASSGKLMASGDASNKVVVWNLEADPPVLMHTLGLHTARVTCLDWLANGQLVTGSLDRHLVVWDAEAGAKKLKLEEVHKGGVTALAAATDGSFGSVGYDGFLEVNILA
jgi:WD40 repeat protein